ncbi:UDP-N-acetylmuramoyl-L-alanyl-D-glutamate--2,6-diaminopimelate ligase [Patescibacteria group bacterium]|nr:UDP-N-acetylmuramoyl-L-alanyl-D-glutamate--2,6-diaminopimelate ligase [Patescibacteria group bacterium]
MMKFFKKIIPLFIINWYHFSLAFLGTIIYRFPSQKLKVIGVTGTNGKTTVVEMIAKILEEADYKVAVLNSIKFKIGGKELPNELRMTMPGRFFIQRFLRQAADAHCQYAVLEVTSEGIKQYRHRFIDFEAAVLTNLAPEHIEAHKGFENYKKAKGKLFEATKRVHIINLDDNNAEYFLQFPAKEKFGYGIRKQELGIREIKFIKAENIKVEKDKISFLIHNSLFQIPLLGEFNVYNALAAISVGISRGIDSKICKSAVERIEGIPGRMELVISEPFKVFVDYAFTPNALQKVYETLSGIFNFPPPKAGFKSTRIPLGSYGIPEGQIRNSKFQKPKLICVLGSCGGGRDKWKRPVLGEIAAKYCDEAILTNEDPYDENPLKIMEDIESGFSQIPNSKFQILKYEKILDRREAIRKALTLAKKGDIVIITGKGCEPSICLAKGKRIPWDDRKAVKEEFRKLNQKT